MYIADFLSRNHVETGNSEEDIEFVNSVMALSINSKREEELRQATESDETSKKILELSMKG